MAKSTYIGVNGIARKVKKIYVGVNGVARKVKKAYVGVYHSSLQAPLARLVFKLRRNVVFEKTFTGLSTSIGYESECVKCGDVVLFAGGTTKLSSTTRQTAKVQFINNQLTGGSATCNLPVAVSRFASACDNRDMAIFGGGYNRSSGLSNRCIAYTSSGTGYLNSTDLSVKRQSLSAESAGQYVLFAGGNSTTSTSSPQVSSVVDYYKYGVLYGTINLSVGRCYLTSTNIGDNALFGGGISGTGTSAYSNVVDKFNSSLTRQTLESLSVSRGYFAAASSSNHALFGGGYTINEGSGQASSTVDAYNSSFTRLSAVNLTEAKYGLAATDLDEYVLFYGGNGSTGYVDVYDSSLTHTNLSQTYGTGKYYLPAASLEDYAFFGPGNATIPLPYVDIFTLE